MIKHDQNGSINGLLLPLIVVTLVFIGVSAFAVWAYGSRQDYKSNTDAKIAEAVTLAHQSESTAKDKQFAELEKKPLRTYHGPQAYGSLVVQYPKTWSGYVEDNGTSGAPVNGYFYPGTVPAVNDPNASFALRIQVIQQNYSTVLAGLRGQSSIGKIQVSPYALPLVSSAVGVRVDGDIAQGKTGTLIILPLRDKTVELSTEGSEFAADFANNILPNLTFAP